MKHHILAAATLAATLLLSGCNNSEPEVVDPRGPDQQAEALKNAAPVELPQEDFVGASCENVNWTTVAAESREMRVYLHPDSGTAYFGVNQIVLKLENAK